MSLISFYAPSMKPSATNLQGAQRKAAELQKQKSSAGDAKAARNAERDALIARYPEHEALIRHTYAFHLEGIDFFLNNIEGDLRTTPGGLGGKLNEVSPGRATPVGAQKGSLAFGLGDTVDQLESGDSNVGKPFERYALLAVVAVIGVMLVWKMKG